MGPPSNRLTFNHLHCPYRCGACFSESEIAMAIPELRKLISQQLLLRDRVQQMASKTIMENGDKSVFEKSPDQFLQYALDTVPVFQCRSCDILFVGKTECCAASDEQPQLQENNFCTACESTPAKLASSHAPSDKLFSRRMRSDIGMGE